MARSWRRRVARTVAGSNRALSSTSSRVDSSTFEPSPPMTPAMATVDRESAMTRSAVSSVIGLPSRVVVVSLASARLTMMPPPSSFSASKACRGWPVSNRT